MPSKRHTFGQFETPVAVADVLLAFCLRHAGDRILDPSCGAGALLQRATAWLEWLAPEERHDLSRLWGVELDEEAVRLARSRLPQATILHQNFFTLTPPEEFDAIVGNPPYTRGTWIDRLDEQVARQLAMFEDAPDGSAVGEDERNHIIPTHLWETDLNRRAGLHAYFFLHGVRFLREGGRFGFVMPNNWLDVDYGAALKQFLQEHFKIIALIESTVERWFVEARVNTCLVILEKCNEPRAREANLVRFVQLRQRLSDLMPHMSMPRVHFSDVEALTTRLLPAQDRTSQTIRARVIRQSALQAREKWGLHWRAPAFYRNLRQRSLQRNEGARGLAPLKQWATVQRGFTTGANAFFYLDDEAVETWQIEPRFRRPLLKSLRDVRELRPGSQTRLQVLSIAPTASLAGTNAGAYVAWGESQGFKDRPTCRARKPWYTLPHQEPAPLVLAKGIWERHLAPWLAAPLLVDQQLYRIYLRPGVPPATAAALLNSSWTALQLELQGRVNFGEGVLWLATYEVQNILLPDPRAISRDEASRIGKLFEALSSEPVSHDLALELAREERRALDEAVFALIGLSPTEATILLETLQERAAARQAQAR